MDLAAHTDDEASASMEKLCIKYTESCHVMRRRSIPQGQSMCSQLHLECQNSPLLMSTMRQTASFAWMTSSAPSLCRVGTACAARVAQKQLCRSMASAQSVAHLLMAIVIPQCRLRHLLATFVATCLMRSGCVPKIIHLSCCSSQARCRITA